MTKKVEYKVNSEVASFMLENYPWISNVSVDVDENYAHWDITYTATTLENKEYVGTQEVKTIMNYPIKENGEFRDYFKYDIKNKMKFGNVPPPISDTRQLPVYWKYTPTYEEMPEEMKDKPIYFLNASDNTDCIHNSKWHYMNRNNTGLSIVAEDGVIMFNHKQLTDAFLGYAWYYQPAHTELYHKKYEPHWELKAVIDLSKGSYYKHNIDNNLFKK